MSQHADFIERVAALAGRTTYRVPVEGRSTAGGGPTEQDVAAALAMGRRRRNGLPDHTDIGPEVALGMVTRARYRKPDVTTAVARAIERELKLRGMFYRIAIAVNGAYEDLVFGTKTARPEGFPPDVWRTLYDVAFRVMISEANEALTSAERAFWREGRPPVAKVA